jgi:UDP:flavonoid glycosyltransferase YjiC (YdhE family)
MIRPAELNPDTLHDAITSVLNSPEHTNAARVLATEIAAMPPPSATARHIVTTLE